jgi:hypothetical protein
MEIITPRELKAFRVGIEEGTAVYVDAIDEILEEHQEWASCIGAILELVIQKQSELMKPERIAASIACAVLPCDGKIQ